MKFFSLFNKEQISIAPGKKVIPREEFSLAMEGFEIIEKAKKDEIIFREKAEKEGEEKGFQEGLLKFNEQIIYLEEERKKARAEMENSLVPLAISAVKKIIGRELQLKSETVVDIIATGLKSVSHHRKIKIYVNKIDLEMVEKERNRLRELFDHLESLTISSREDVEEKGCIVETEAGIVHLGLENQLKALETAFQTFFHKEKGL